jgi:2-iminobutanoate/2-iminopropanoate deaminase
MNREPIATEHAPRAIGPYSQAVEANGVLFCSGQIALDPAAGKLVGEGDVRAQTERVMKNLGAVLEAGGASFGSVVKTTIYLADMNDFAAVNEVYGSFFEGDSPPARATVQVSRLPKDALVEVDAIALAERPPTHEVD